MISPLFFIPFNKQRIKRYWESHEARIHSNPKSYNSKSKYDRFALNIVNLAGNLEPNRILDIGCADGCLSSKICSHYNCPVDGIEPSSRLLSKYSELAIGTSYDYSANDNWNLESNSYQLILAHGVIQYLSYQEINKMASNSSIYLDKKLNSKFIIIGICDNNLMLNWYLKDYSSLNILQRCKRYLLYLSALITSRLWPDGSMWHDTLKIRDIMSRYFDKVDICFNSNDYRSSIICSYEKTF